MLCFLTNNPMTFEGRNIYIYMYTCVCVYPYESGNKFKSHFLGVTNSTLKKRNDFHHNL